MHQSRSLLCLNRIGRSQRKPHTHTHTSPAPRCDRTRLGGGGGPTRSPWRDQVPDVAIRTLERDLRGLQLALPGGRDLANVHTATASIERVLGAVERYASELPEVIAMAEAQVSHGLNAELVEEAKMRQGLGHAIWFFAAGAGVGGRGGGGSDQPGLSALES
ncbi:unnamed protein product [Effrenium voratum]|nr:unnamed protein product [Effrenium voratum]